MNYTKCYNLRMQLEKGTVIQVTIHDLAFGGAGVGRWRGQTGQAEEQTRQAEKPAQSAQLQHRQEAEKKAEIIVFVPGALPGDRVEARILRSKKNFCEAELVQIIKKAPNRIAARCKHFDICGGCSLQNLAYEDQLAWKEKMVRDALERIGGIETMELLPIIGCDSPWFYRNKMEYSFGYEKKLEAPRPEDLYLGLHPPKRFHDVFDLQECFLMSELAPHIVDVVRQWAREHNLEPYHDRRNEKHLRSLIVREGKNTGEIMVNLIYNGREKLPLEDFAGRLKKNFPQITSIYATGFQRGRGSKTKHCEQLLEGKPAIIETLTVDKTTLHFEILPEAFFQPNTKQAEVLYGEVLKAAHFEDWSNARSAAADSGATVGNSPLHVLDLFCGTGTIGMFFAQQGAQVTGIELNRHAIESAKKNATRNNIDSIEFICGDVREILPNLAPQSDLMITDPPRAGIDESALHTLLKFKIKNWIYVSCNPTTLARDLKIALQHGYSIKKIQPVDMFPQTFHVETVATLTLT